MSILKKTTKEVLYSKGHIKRYVIFLVFSENAHKKYIGESIAYKCKEDVENNFSTISLLKNSDNLLEINFIF